MQSTLDARRRPPRHGICMQALGESQEVSMNRRCLWLALALTVGLVAASASAQTFGAVLTGSQEVPATTSPGFGNFTGTFDIPRTSMTVTLTVANLGSPISGFHIHEKAAGQPSGGIVINFQGLGGTF